MTFILAFITVLKNKKSQTLGTVRAIYYIYGLIGVGAWNRRAHC